MGQALNLINEVVRGVESDLAAPKPGGAAEITIPATAAGQRQMLVFKVFRRVGQIIQPCDGFRRRRPQRLAVFPEGQAFNLLDSLGTITLQTADQF